MQRIDHWPMTILKSISFQKQSQESAVMRRFLLSVWMNRCVKKTGISSNITNFIYTNDSDL